MAIDYSLPEEQVEMLDKMMSNIKTGFGPGIAHQIVDSGRSLPSLVESMFNKIKIDLHI